MLDKDIIEPSTSPWASAIVLVRRRTGDIRVCIDFRRLNGVTKKCVHPLPNIGDCLEPLCGNRYFSQLDLASGYWQISINERDREKTTFRTEEGQFHFKRMPFGLCNAPASFPRLMNALYLGLKGEHLQVFFDDLCVATKSWEELLELLEEVFRTSTNAPSELYFHAQHTLSLHSRAHNSALSVCFDAQFQQYVHSMH